MPINNILVYCESSFDIKCGGLTVQYELCKILENMGINVRIQAPNKIRNSIFDKYYNNNFNLDETIVIYGETINGNPLNAPHVLRWILAPIGKCSSIETSLSISSRKKQPRKTKSARRKPRKTKSARRKPKSARRKPRKTKSTRHKSNKYKR